MNEREPTREELIEQAIAWKNSSPAQITLFVDNIEYITPQEIPEKTGIKFSKHWSTEVRDSLGNAIMEEAQRNGIKRPNYTRAYTDRDESP